MIICPRCQAQNSDGTVQCGRCGYPLQMSNYYGQQVQYFNSSQQNLNVSQPNANEYNFDSNNRSMEDNNSNRQPNTSSKLNSIEKQDKKNNNALYWQIISAICLVGILLIMIFNTITNLNINNRTTNNEKKIDKIAKRLKNQSFKDFNINTVTGEDRPSYYWDLRNSSGSTSYQFKNNLPKLVGNYYLIEGYIEDVYSSGLVKIKVGIRGLDTKYSDSDASIWVYGFSEDQLLDYKKQQTVQIVVKIVYSETASSDGLRDDLYSVIGIYVQDA